MTKYLITGGAGFIGSNFIRYVLEREPDAKIINFDNLSSGSLDNLRDVEFDKRYGFYEGDVAQKSELEIIVKRRPDVIINFAAQIPDDNGNQDAEKFLKTNIDGAVNVLELARVYNIARVILISTTGVYGPSGLAPAPASGKILPTSDVSVGASPAVSVGAGEEHLLNPEGAHSISKTAGEVAARCYKDSVFFNIARLGPVFGPYQDPTRILPKIIINFLSGQNLKIEKDSGEIRQWINVFDVCEGILKIISNGKPGEVYNLGGDKEMSVLETANFIADYIGRPRVDIDGGEIAPENDAFSNVGGGKKQPERYACDSSKIRSLGWRQKNKLEESLRDTVEWYKHNRWWWEKQKREDYFEYYRKQYLG